MTLHRSRSAPTAAATFGLGLLLVTAVLGGCDRAPASSQSAPSQAAGSTGANATALPGAASGGPQSPGPELVFGPGDFDLPDVAIGLDALQSYRATLTTSFSGTVAGASAEWSVTRALVVSPDGVGLTISTTGSGAPAEPAGEWELAGARLALTEGGRCVVNAADATRGGLRAGAEPARLLSGIAGGELRETDTTGAELVAFDERALALPGAAKANGSLAYAPSTNVVTAYDLTVTGEAAYFGEGIVGSLQSSYRLSAINEAVALDVADACPAGGLAAPLPAGADVTTDVPGLQAFATSASIEEVLDFYREKAASLGWTLTDGPAFTDAAGYVSFTSDRGSIDVVVTHRDNVTNAFVVFDAPAE